MYVLRNWRAVESSSDGAGTKEILIGDVYGCPDIPDGTRIATSPVLRRERFDALTTEGFRYLLVRGRTSAPGSAFAHNQLTPELQAA